MKVGVFLPISGRAASGVLLEAAQRAEALGFDSVWAADRIVTPWRIDTPYAYNEDRRFFVPPDVPFLEPLTCLAYLAGGTSRITLGMSVLVLPYRHPLHWAKVATTLDHLSRGRFVLGVGVGWMVEEFAALGRADVFAQRGAVSDEQLRLVETLWTEPRPRFAGRFYRFDEIGFEPKPLQRPRVPIWVGGEGRAARRRAGRHGDAWFPYFVRITPETLAGHFLEVRRFAAEAGRDPAEVRLSCCLPIEITETPVAQAPDRVAGTPEQVAAMLSAFAAAGVEHVALQFMVPRWPLRALQIERFAAETLPRLR
jgi:probable F420-dependent oxidoreductase